MYEIIDATNEKGESDLKYTEFSHGNVCFEIQPKK